MTRVLVTGATGWLGGHALRALMALPDVEPIAACRTPERLPGEFHGEVRPGDLRDPAYRDQVVRGVDAVLHAGTWGAMFGHREQERAWFFEPTVDLMARCIEHGVGRFLLASTVAIADPRSGGPFDDFSPTARTEFWPHQDYLVELDALMRASAHRGTQMVTLRLGHFVGRGNALGLVPAIVPRLRTGLVPLLAGGRSRLALVSGEDLGQGCALAATVEGLQPFESFNLVGPDLPTTREVFTHIARRVGAPVPWFSVPHGAGIAFGWLMEQVHAVIGGQAPFLTRAIVHVARDWDAPTDHARDVLGYVPRVGWQEAVDDALDELGPRPGWPRLAQGVQ